MHSHSRQQRREIVLPLARWKLENCQIKRASNVLTPFDAQTRTFGDTSRIGFILQAFRSDALTDDVQPSAQLVTAYIH